MTKNDGPKKRARATARKLGIPFSEAKTRRTAEAEVRKGNGRPGPITLKVHPGHLGFQWDRSKDFHAIIEGRPGSGKTRLAESIAVQARANGEAVIMATMNHLGVLTLLTCEPHSGAHAPADVDSWGEGADFGLASRSMSHEDAPASYDREGALLEMLQSVASGDAQAVHDGLPVAAGRDSGVSVAIIAQDRGSVPAAILDAADLWVSVGEQELYGRLYGDTEMVLSRNRLTRKEAFGRDRGVYTIVHHWGIGLRGPHDSWGHPAVTREDCEEVAAAIESEKDLLRLSVRNSVVSGSQEGPPREVDHLGGRRSFGLAWGESGENLGPGAMPGSFSFD